MVLEGIADSVARVVLLVGLPVLFVLFYLEGLVLGKILQPPAVFVTVIGISRPDTGGILALSAGCALAVVLGQWTTFRSFDPTVTGGTRGTRHVDALAPRVIDRLGERRMRLIDRAFARFGGLAIFGSAFLPVIRGTLAIPAGMSGYPQPRFLLVTAFANVLYFPLLAAIAFGLLRLLGLE